MMKTLTATRHIDHSGVWILKGGRKTVLLVQPTYESILGIDPGTDAFTQAAIDGGIDMTDRRVVVNS